MRVPEEEFMNCWRINKKNRPTFPQEINIPSNKKLKLFFFLAVSCSLISALTRSKLKFSSIFVPKKHLKRCFSLPWEFPLISSHQQRVENGKIGENLNKCQSEVSLSMKIDNSFWNVRQESGSFSNNNQFYLSALNSIQMKARRNGPHVVSTLCRCRDGEKLKIQEKKTKVLVRLRGFCLGNEWGLDCLNSDLRLS